MNASKPAEQVELDKKLGGRVRDVRQRYEWTQATLAAKLNMSQHNWARYESGKYGLSVYQLAQLSVIFGITIDGWFVADDCWQKFVPEL